MLTKDINHEPLSEELKELAIKANYTHNHPHPINEDEEVDLKWRIRLTREECIVITKHRLRKIIRRGRNNG